MDLEVFHRCCLSASFVGNIPRTVDGYVDEIESTVTAVLDDLASLHSSNQLRETCSARWLLLEAVEEKKHGRQLHTSVPGQDPLTCHFIAEFQSVAVGLSTATLNGDSLLKIMNDICDAADTG